MLASEHTPAPSEMTARSRSSSAATSTISRPRITAADAIPVDVRACGEAGHSGLDVGVAAASRRR
jgi:hypothetical protein